jgi:hypothetical protein
MLNLGLRISGKEYKNSSYFAPLVLAESKEEIFQKWAIFE